MCEQTKHLKVISNTKAKQISLSNYLLQLFLYLLHNLHNLLNNLIAKTINLTSNFDTYTELKVIKHNQAYLCGLFKEYQQQHHTSNKRILINAQPGQLYFKKLNRLYHAINSKIVFCCKQKVTSAMNDLIWAIKVIIIQSVFIGWSGIKEFAHITCCQFNLFNSCLQTNNKQQSEIGSALYRVQIWPPSFPLNF